MPTSDIEARAAVARLCRNLTELSDHARRADRLTELSGIVARALEGADVTAELRGLIRALGGPEDTFRVGLPWHGGPPTGEIYICPTGRCDRSETREPSAPLPTCRLDGADLRADLRR